MNNNQKYNQIFMDIFGVDSSELNENFTFQLINSWDSLTHLTLISEIENTFDIMFETEDILHFGGFENGKKILAKYGVVFEGQ